MTTKLEISANAFNALSIFLAGRNSIHTWWIGIIGCLLFGILFYEARLYADVNLQLFFMITSISGWWKWKYGKAGAELPIQKSKLKMIVYLTVAATLVAVVYGWLLLHFTSAYAPYFDSLVLAFSILGQFLLIDRRIETWWCWLVVNSIAVPLYSSRGLYLTAALYLFFWINAFISNRVWRRELQTT